MAVLKAGLLTFTVIAVTSATFSSYCPKSCTCYDQWMICDGKFPKLIPSNITDVELLDIEADMYVDGVFCKTSWKTVRSLRLDCSLTCHHLTSMGNDTFRCLHNLESIKITFDQLNSLDKGTFAGLETVTSLDLTGCQRLCSSSIITALSNSTVLPQLSELTLKSFGNIGCSTEIEIDQMFVDILGKRPIQRLDFSYSNVIFIHPDLTTLCDTLRSIDFSHSTFGTRSRLSESKVCKSLQVLNLNDAHLTRAGVPPINFNVTNQTTSVDRRGPLFWYINNIYLNGLVSKDFSFSFQNCSVLVTKNNVTNLELCGYTVINFDVSIQVTENHLRRIALANNSMESIGKNVFQNLKLLHEIDLSYNRLSLSISFDKTFQHLFRKNILLEKLYLSENDLKYLPFDSFNSNKMLSLLELSGNKFKQIAFNVTSLLYLQRLDMQNNSITALNDDSRNALDTLYRLQRNANMNRTVEVDLRGNPLVCTCDSLKFVQWFVSSPHFTNKDHYTCQSDGHSFPMNEMAISAAKEDCERPIRRRRTIILATLVPSMTVFCVFCITIVIIKQRRRLLRHKRFNDHVRLLQDDCVDFRFLVFLSFSSEDDAFVMEHVATPMQHVMKKKCKSDKELVCIGDRYFRPGQTIFSEMIRCLDDSAVFVAVMSKNYCNSDYCKLEIEQARLQRKPCILIFKEEVEEEDMTLVIREVFRKYTRVKFVVHDGVYQLQPDWKSVCESIIQLME